MADQPVHEPLGLGPELGGLGLELGQRLGQAVGDLDLPAAQGADQLVLVVAGHAERVARADHAHDQPQHARRVRPAVDQVADEDRAAVRVAGAGRPARARPGLIDVAELGQQGLQLGGAAVDVADDVERPGLVAQVVEEPGAGDRRGGDLLLAVQDVDGPEAFLAAGRAGTAAGRRAGGGSRGRRSRGRGGSRSARGRRSPARRARSRSAARRARAPARPASGARRAARWSRPRRSAAPPPAACRR